MHFFEHVPASPFFINYIRTIIINFIFENQWLGVIFCLKYIRGHNDMIKWLKMKMKQKKGYS